MLPNGTEKTTSMSNINIEISASAVAWYAAIIGTISLVTSIYLALRDRAKIRIKYQRDMAVMNSPLYDRNKTYFNVTVTNIGRRPIRISNTGVRTVGRERKFALFADSVMRHTNKVLTEENPYVDFMMEQDEDLLNSAWYIVVYDGTGREYRKYMHRLPMLWRIYYGWKKRNKGTKAEQA